MVPEEPVPGAGRVVRATVVVMPHQAPVASDAESPGDHALADAARAASQAASEQFGFEIKCVYLAALSLLFLSVCLCNDIEPAE